MSTLAPGPTTRISVEEFVARHAGPRTELVKGIVREYPMPGLEHGMICQNIAGFIWTHVRQANLGRVMSNDSWVRTGEDTVRGGDVLFYSYERLPREQPVPRGLHSVVADLVVEVKSPTDRWGELFSKIGEYLQAGVRVVVLLDPETATASVYRPEELQQILDNGDELKLPDVLPGFSVPVAQLFA